MLGTSAEQDVPVEALGGHRRRPWHNRRRAHDPRGEGQACTGRTRLVKVAAYVFETARRVVVQLSASWPYLHHFASVNSPVRQGRVPARDGCREVRRTGSAPYCAGPSGLTTAVGALTRPDTDRAIDSHPFGPHHGGGRANPPGHGPGYLTVSINSELATVISRPFPLRRNGVRDRRLARVRPSFDPIRNRVSKV